MDYPPPPVGSLEVEEENIRETNVKSFLNIHSMELVQQREKNIRVFFLIFLFCICCIYLRHICHNNNPPPPPPHLERFTLV